MRKLAAMFVLVAVLLAAVRLLTGIVYGADSPVAYFVVKTTPATWIERPEAAGPPVGSDIVLDTEETQLAYGQLYVALMQGVPALVMLMVAGTLGAVTLGRRRRVA